mgnify:CR=1 FL=1
MPFIRAQKESRRDPPSGCGGFKFIPCFLAEARPLAFRPPSGFFPSLRCHAGVLAIEHRKAGYRPHTKGQICVRAAQDAFTGERNAERVHVGVARDTVLKHDSPGCSAITNLKSCSSACFARTNKATYPRTLCKNRPRSCKVRAFNVGLHHGAVPLLGRSDGSGTVARIDRKSTRLNSSHSQQSRMPSSA